MSKPTVSELFSALTQAIDNGVDTANQDEVIAHCDTDYPTVANMLQSIDSFTYYQLLDKYEQATS
jgi:hypothetical protein